jgi:hypothetical protein
MRILAGPAVTLGLLLSGCVSAPPPAAPAPQVALASADDRVADVITAALEADARFATADSLYQPDVEVVANGERRFAPPRYAGVEPGGAVAVSSTRVEFRGGLAWSLVEYRWMSTAAGRAVEARATFILVPDGAGVWRIRHAHSSSAEAGGGEQVSGK